MLRLYTLIFPYGTQIIKITQVAIVVYFFHNVNLNNQKFIHTRGVKSMLHDEWLNHIVKCFFFVWVRRSHRLFSFCALIKGYPKLIYTKSYYMLEKKCFCCHKTTNRKIDCKLLLIIFKILAKFFVIILAHHYFLINILFEI